MQSQEPILVIEAGQIEKQYWQDIWNYRELFYFLAWRDILVRYKQTVIGVLWAIIRPLLSMVVFTVIFRGLAGLASDGDVPYPVLVFAGTLPWNFFSASITAASNSLTGSANMIKKIYCPRLILPVSTIVVGIVDLLVAGMIMLAMMIWYGVIPGWRVILLPFLIFLAASTSLGIGLWVASLNVRYRDFKHIIPFLVQIGSYISPVGFSSSRVPDEFRFLYSLNPMVGVIDGFRWCLLGQDIQLYAPGFMASILLSLLLLGSGIWYFRSVEKNFADYI